jgi:hypothetical protein
MEEMRIGEIGSSPILAILRVPYSFPAERYELIRGNLSFKLERLKKK